MKKLICLVLAVCMALSLAACGSKPAQESARPSETEDTTQNALDYGAPENWA